MSISLTLIDGSSVTLKETFENYRASIGDNGGPVLIKQYLAPSWAQAFSCVNALRGTVTVAGGIGGAISRAIPHRPADSPNLVCLSAELEPVAEVDAKDSGRPQFRLPLINCTYGIPQYDVQSTDDVGALNSFPNDDSPGQPWVYATQSIDFGQETFKLPGSAYKYSTAPQLPVDTPMAATVGVATLVFVRKFVPYFPVTLLLSKQNRLNSSTFLGQPRGLIKFTGARTRREFLSDGKATQEIELHFKWREYDHNKIHRPDETSYDFIVDPSGNKPYVYADLRPLLA